MLGGMGEAFVGAVSLLSAAPAAFRALEVFLVLLRGYSLQGCFFSGPSARLSPGARAGGWFLVRPRAPSALRLFPSFWSFLFLPFFLFGCCPLLLSSFVPSPV